RFQFTETTDPNAANIKFIDWGSIFAGRCDLEDVELDEEGPYLNLFEIEIRGPPGGSTLEPEQLKHLVSHEILHTFYALGNHSPHIQDQFHAQVTERMNAGYPLGPNTRERKGIKLIYDLERNPRILDY